ncbi:LysR family transcriptional regulator [Aureimonas fodinaquatilis]|uniref:LysR family transcriptional regulator n=1 Tax=Aureimonas fodinaquatilis TaxID=2565783 RepID=A0A5B0E0A8_9HYPH|nr:LysR substrate-binding domain-containing protein [Aureimonas fodinaquatilis]KAA0972126.1 LysR family transcriptional regulator [Aureimonas fodinaquatilis]
MLTIRQMRYFETLAETLHFGRAAQRLNISQPALSGQIAQMEMHFGFQLFERRPSGVTVTGAGQQIREKVQRILGEIRDLEGFARYQAGLSGPLSMGVIASVAPYLLPALLQQLAIDFPQLELSLRESTTEKLLADLSIGHLDCALVALPVEDPALTVLELADDEFYLAMAEDQAPRIAVPVRSQALKSQRLILLEEGHCLRQQALSVCQIVESRDLASLGATSLATLLRMVAGGLGVTLAPRLALATEAKVGGIAFLPFQTPAPKRQLALVHRASSGRAADFAEFAALLKEILRNIQNAASETTTIRNPDLSSL